MRLYRMELYKLYHNKIFRIGLFAATALLLAYFWFAEVGGEIAAVDGSVYSGYSERDFDGTFYGRGMCRYYSSSSGTPGAGF